MAAAAGLRALHLQHCRCGAGSSVNPEAAEAAVKAVTPRSSFIQDVSRERKHGGTSPLNLTVGTSHFSCSMAPLPPLLAGVLYVIVLLTATFGYAIFLLAPSLPLLFTVPPFRTTCMRWYHAWSGLIGVHYFGLAATGLELLLGVQVRIYGDELPKGERALILSNHRQAVQYAHNCFHQQIFYTVAKCWRDYNMHCAYTGCFIYYALRTAGRVSTGCSCGVCACAQSSCRS
jgi:hypothetical protein